MSWSLRIALGLIGFAIVGLGLLALNPKAESAHDLDGTGYAFAISHGPGLKLANQDNTLKRGNVEAYAMTARSLSCEVVLTIGAIEFGTRCAFEPGPAADQAQGTGTGDIETGSIAGSD